MNNYEEAKKRGERIDKAIIEQRNKEIKKLLNIEN